MRTSNRFKTTIVKEGLPNTLLTSSIITTPCERVLSILRQVKTFITNIAENQTKLIQDLDWCIKIITSRSLYSYELREKETINQLSEGNPEIKQLVDFVSEYNEKVIKMSRKYNILTDELLQKSSTKLNKRKIERKNSFSEKDTHFSKILHLEEGLEEDPIQKFKKNNEIVEKKEFVKRKNMNNSYIKSQFNTINNVNKNNKSLINNNSLEENPRKKRMRLKKKNNL